MYKLLKKVRKFENNANYSQKYRFFECDDGEEELIYRMVKLGLGTEPRKLEKF